MAARMPLKKGIRHPHLAGLTLYLDGFDGFNAMPIYEYRCNACGHELEKIQRMTDEPLSVCPDCGEPELRRLVSAPGFRLKGGGWYETDFKKDGKRNLHDSHSPAGASTGGSSEAKDPAKPAESKKTPDKPAAAKSDTS